MIPSILATPTPEPLPPGQIRALLDAAGVTVAIAAGILRITRAKLHGWTKECLTRQGPPWYAVELLRLSLLARYTERPELPTRKKRVRVVPVLSLIVRE